MLGAMQPYLWTHEATLKVRHFGMTCSFRRPRTSDQALTRKRGEQWVYTQLLARIPLIGWPLAKLLTTMTPSVLVLSMPRSDSSWLGSILGNTHASLYLREPLTQGSKVYGSPQVTVFEVDPEHPPVAYQKCADWAFAGYPHFPGNIVPYRCQWRLSDRRQKRVVIKEVNPLALHWLLNTYRPLVIYLIRHPAAVALSYFRMGWRALLGEEDWSAHGQFQARVHRYALDRLASYKDHCIVSYEHLCMEPSEVLGNLVRFADLPWNDDVWEYANLTMSGQPESQDPYSVTRNSQMMVDAWRQEITEAQFSSLELGYRQWQLPLYHSDGDW